MGPQLRPNGRLAKAKNLLSILLACLLLALLGHQTYASMIKELRVSKMQLQTAMREIRSKSALLEKAKASNASYNIDLEHKLKTCERRSHQCYVSKGVVEYLCEPPRDPVLHPKGPLLKLNDDTDELTMKFAAALERANLSSTNWKSDPNVLSLQIEDCSYRVQSAREDIGKLTDELENTVRDAKIELSRSVLEADSRLLKGLLARYGESMKEEWEDALSRQPKRGIFTLAGPEQYLSTLFATLWVVRRYWNSTLPIIVLYVLFFFVLQK